MSDLDVRGQSITQITLAQEYQFYNAVRDIAERLHISGNKKNRADLKIIVRCD